MSAADTRLDPRFDPEATAYREALARYIDCDGEAALTNGYEIGRRIMSEGRGIPEITSLHHQAATEILRDRPSANAPDFVRKAGEFLIESLTPFEISHRGVAEANSALRRLNELLEDELKRTGRALHDQAGNILATATLELDLLAKDLTAEERERMALARSLLDEAGEQLRHLSHELRPTLLDDLGLTAAIAYLAEGIEQRSNIRVQLSSRLKDRPSTEVETALYRIVQEALNNVVRHSGASTTVTIVLDRTDGQVRCQVLDDGAGFRVSDLSEPGKVRGMGLLGMRERAQALGGTLDVRSAPGAGTTVEVTLPDPVGGKKYGGRK